LSCKAKIKAPLIYEVQHKSTHRLINSREPNDFRTHQTYKLDNSQAQQLTNSSTHKLTNSRTHQLTYSSIHQLINSQTDQLINSPAHQLNILKP